MKCTQKFDKIINHVTVRAWILCCTGVRPFCLDLAVVVVVEIAYQFGLKMFHGVNLLQIELFGTPFDIKIIPLVIQFTILSNELELPKCSL